MSERTKKIIKWCVTFAFATLLTLLFAVLVSAALYFKLKKIDPVSSLGSVE